MERPPSRPGRRLFLAVGRLSDGYDLRKRYKERLSCLYVVTMGTASGCLRLLVGGSRRTGRGDRDAARDSFLNCGCWARGWRSGQSLACRQAGWDEQGHVHVAVGERGQASDFSLVVDVERFGQVQGRAPDQAVRSAGFTLNALRGILPFLLLSIAIAAYAKAAGADNLIARAFEGRVQVVGTFPAISKLRMRPGLLHKRRWTCPAARREGGSPP